jgi:hypothetical protein
MRLPVPEDFSALGQRIPSFVLDLWIFANYKWVWPRMQPAVAIFHNYAIRDVGDLQCLPETLIRRRDASMEGRRPLPGNLRE